MSQVIKPKRGTTAPTTSNLADGEFAIDYSAKVVYQRIGGSIVAVANYSAGGDPWTYVTLASEFSTGATSTASVNVTGLSFTPAAGKTYVVEGLFLLRSDATGTGAQPGVAWPSGLSDGTAYIDATNGASAIVTSLLPAGTSGKAAALNTPTTTGSYPAQLNALVVTGASPSGNFQITLATETLGVLVRMRAGSHIRYREIT